MTGPAGRTAVDAAGSAPLREVASKVRHEIETSVGQPLDGALRRRMEARVAATERALPAGAAWGFHGLEAAADSAAGDGRTTEGPATDFSAVRLHADGHAASAARHLGASAFTIGDHVYADPARLPASGAERDGHFAHELAHVAQQRRIGRTLIQPRLIATGSAADIQRFIALAEPAMGERLHHDPVTGRITAVASLVAPAAPPVFGPAPVRSAAFLAAMHTIMDDPLQDAEAHFGAGQARVAVGAFPQAPATVQRIDMDDVEAIETGAPGSGIGKLAHELTENYVSHGPAAGGGGGVFAPAHERGLAAESDVTEETVGPGRRVAGVDTPEVGGTFTRVQDFENYYLVFNLTRNAGSNFTVSNARHAPRVNVLTTTIDQFATGSAALPPAGAAAVAAAAVAVAANPSATVRIEGFTDNVDTAVLNIILSIVRADTVTAALVAAGVRAGRIHSLGLGETRPAAPNDTEANRARNRRVVITVDRPGP